jgi:hypothetical protein
MVARRAGVGKSDDGTVGPALEELGIEWKDVMAFGVHSDLVVVIEGPVGYKRTYMFPGAVEVEGRGDPGGFTRT